MSCNSYTPSGKLLKAWGPAQTALDTTCPAAAAPVTVADRVTQTVYNLDNSVQIVKKAVGSGIAQGRKAMVWTPPT
ncbi:hypothetical protein ACH518_04145 [Methylomonas sp. HW2-6]|uniref:hypothetical protein n=1 Tax=Methylomonas sp. HW2-6 TaxID=3376687 RepID=UPI0040435E05